MGFGANLVAIRKARGMTRKELAEELEIPYTTLRNYETDQREPGHKLLIRLSKLFGVSVDELVGNINAETKKSPSTTEVAPGEEEIFRLATALNDMLVAQGVIQDGNDLTDRQSEVLLAVCRIIDATFKD